MKWNRYRFITNEKDYRPLVFNPKYPWWHSGIIGDKNIIVAYLPKKEPLKKYWTEATEIFVEEFDELSFSDRFPEPSYFIK